MDSRKYIDNTPRLMHALVQVPENGIEPLRTPVFVARVRRKAMSATGLAAVVLMVIIVMFVISNLRQILAFLLYAVVIVFCFGVYYIVSTIAHIIQFE
jgi:ABC-type polysaccharide/polyol phosphate export permease